MLKQQGGLDPKQNNQHILQTALEQKLEFTLIEILTDKNKTYFNVYNDKANS